MHGKQRGRFRWGFGKDRKSDVDRLKRDREQWADHSFKVLGVEIGHLPEHQQVALLAGGVFFFLLIYGYMQVTAAFVACAENLRWTG